MINNKIRGITEVKQYGHIVIKLNTLMDKNDISIYQMSKLTGLKYSTIKSYYTNAPITRLDMDILSKMCYVLNCKLEDIIEYRL